ncbi:MAG: PhoH family protein [Wohlfahrtiimonas sp.]
MLELTFPDNNERLANLCGNLNSHLQLIEKHFAVEIANRGPKFKITGAEFSETEARTILEYLYDSTAEEVLDEDIVRLALHSTQFDRDDFIKTSQENRQEIVLKNKRGLIRGRTTNQKHYLSEISHNAINFGIGPAGTGKTFLAVASAVDALERQNIRRIILVRPAVEAGEKLGFLPGDLTQKVDPYLRPLYDALYEMLGFETVLKLIERNVIEIAPLAFMRGRTLNDAFIILDEAQNTTTEQMKMFLTRLGFNSTAVITGDVSQIDLPKHVQSGLKNAMTVLNNVDGITMTFFDSTDVVRHPLVAKIINAYQAAEDAKND